MTHVHYKFSSKLSYDTVVLDSPHITLRDLRTQIMCREKLRAGDCDLLITNAQTKQEYTDDEGLVPKGSSVIVRRIPTSGGKSNSSSKAHNSKQIDRSLAQPHHNFEASKLMNDQTSSSTLHFFSKMANLADADVSEEDKIKVMLNQSCYDSMNYSKKFGTVLPANYTCFRCGHSGHHIRNCPTSGDKNFEAPLRIKKSTGIPRSFMVEVDDPSVKGAMLTNCGRYAIPAIDAMAYRVGKKEKPPFAPQEKAIESEAKGDPIPDELLCLICHDLLSDAVVIPCCGNSYCDDCIRTTLLDSEEHVCPTCSQSDVSPDTLIANKFLRQAVNNFKKEKGGNKSLTSTSQYQNPSPVPKPPPLTVQIHPQRPHQSTLSQQAADTQPLCGNPPVATDPASACNMPGASLQTEQSCLEIPFKEAERQTKDESAAPEAADAAPTSEPLSTKEPAAAPSQLIPLVHDATVAEQPQKVSVNKQEPSLATRHSGPTSCLGSSASSSGCSNGGWTESQQLSSSPSSVYPVPSPHLYPPPLFQTYLSAHPSHSGYPPVYPPSTPIWTLPCPQGAPIPSLCPSTSSIPTLVPKEWYRHQRNKEERSPHRESTYRRSSSRSHSKSSKCKPSRSYSRSSSRSRSRSRSRSQGRSRPCSPYSRHRALHTRSHPSHSYGYKRSRSPTPSSSSSPQVGHHSRSKSPSDHRKTRHHGRHHGRKSGLSSHTSARRGERSAGREVGDLQASSTSSPFAQHANQTGSLEQDREHYLQWKKQYKDWYEKYYSSYVDHFHQMPLPINLPPPPQWEGSRCPPHAQSDSGNRPSAPMDGSPSHSSSDSHSTPSQASSDSRSSLSRMSNDSSPRRSRTSSDGRSTPSEERAEPRAHPKPKDRRQPGSRRVPDSSSEKKGKGESREKKEKRKSESPNPLERKKQKKEVKKERQSLPVTERNIWEGGITVKTQKKISININLDGKKKGEKTEKEENIIGEGMEMMGDGGGDEKSVFEEKMKPNEGEERQLWQKVVIGDKETEEEDVGEKKEEGEIEDFDIWHRAVKNEWEEGDVPQKERPSPMEKGEDEEMVREDGRGSVQHLEKETAKGEGRCGENLPGQWVPHEPLMGGEKGRMRKEADTKSQGNESHNREDDSVDGGERTTVLKTPEEYIQDRAAPEKEDRLVLIQAPRPKWEMGEFEEDEQKKAKVKAPEPSAAVLPPPPLTPTDGRETEGEKEPKRRRSVDTKRDGGRDGEREKRVTPSSSDRGVAPSSGRETTEMFFSCAERGMEMERSRDRDRGRESERQRDGRREPKRSKESHRQEERRRDQGREKEEGRKGNLPSSSYDFLRYSASKDVERKERERGGGEHIPSQKLSGSGSSERKKEESDKHAHQTNRDASLDSKRKDKKNPHNYQRHVDPQDRAAGSHPSSRAESSSPGWKIAEQSRGRDESQEEREAWKRAKEERVTKEGEGGEMQAEGGGGGGQGTDEAGESAAGIWREGQRETQEGEKLGSKDGGTERQRGEELLDECELKKHKHKKKKSRRSKD